MRLFLISTALLVSTFSYSGGFQWPNLEYAHAKLFLLNVPFEGPSELDYHIYENGIYAKSKLGDGYNLERDWLDKFHGFMARGVDELIAGLSGCFIPRHGIIYYDKDWKPIASMTICFECERIEFWSSEEILQHTVDPKNFDIDKAEDQIKRMKIALGELSIPMFDDIDKYEAFVDSSGRYTGNGEMFYHEDVNDSVFNEHFSKGQVWLWIHPDIRGKNKFEETVEMKITHGGDKYTYNQLGDANGTRFIYSADDEPYLSEAVIVSNEIILPNGLRVGMSLDDFMAHLGVYDGPAWPVHFNMVKMGYVIDYYFEKRTLVKIELSAR